ncbi:AzlC family ABC transporter permease [Pseudomonas sp. UBA2684]|uniref:AzlC family ABC transporter permease n=1 Tax=Pseudomonas sp. UBA2684 TaxID=1947311 RepID=UPI000E9490E9|nr:AzlC family ABC transporter permease [Pseudomonas sp. UBA2684]HBX54178.1 branched-chain amino acid ABC transporter permease [Pseudomonas sp.]|tara:strand:- start:2400 stop:3113 length:714 start_codon:yes stop_codon:yes gene_type:complete
MTRLQVFLQGIRDSIPMIVGILPFGLIYGALASLAGLSLWQALGMSLLVYAGSAQFIAISLLTVGSGAAVILLTTFIVNLRHVLYSAALQPYVGPLAQRWRLPLAFGLTDETFAVVQRRYLARGMDGHGQWYHAGVALALYLSWVGSSLVGVVFGQSVPNLAGWGLDFAMLATFIGIVVPALRSQPQIAAAVVAAAVALLCHAWPYKLGLMAAALSGIVVGIALERRQALAPNEEAV